MQSKATSLTVLLGLILGALLLGLGGACDRNQVQSTPKPAPATASLRIYALSNLAGALEPCGCQNDMLGGVDHLAALVEAGRRETPSLVVGAGPLFFMNPVLESTRETQDTWKAEALAHSLREIGVSAWAPGFNDWAAGGEQLGLLGKQSGAAILGGNLSGLSTLKQTRVVDVGGVKVGIAGVSLPKYQAALPDGIDTKQLAPALKAARDALKAEGAKLLVALVTAPRGESLRLAELAEGFQLLVVGKPFDQGEGNDKPIPPTLVGQTLVVQAQNHAQSVAVVDVFLRDGSFELQDGSGIAAESERESLTGRVAELDKRIAVWEKTKSIKPEELAQKKQERATLQSKLAQLASPKAPDQGSFFRYQLLQVKEAAGESKAVAGQLKTYYKRVNDHNRVAFKDRSPPPVPAGEGGYIGVEKCATCHADEHKFWKGTQHARAYATLSNDHKEFNLDCVSCHVTGYEKPGGTTVTHVQGLTDVQCEVCHGPGELHAKQPGKAGLITRTPLKSVCAGCHHPPHVGEDWDVNEAWTHIVGPGHGG